MLIFSPMKQNKKSPIKFVTLLYISTKGYIIRIDRDFIFSSAIFTDMDDAKEYIRFKAGKKLSDEFSFAFEEITALVCANSIFKEIYSKTYSYGNGKMQVVNN